MKTQVCNVPVGGKFICNGSEMIVSRKRGQAVEAVFVGVPSTFHQVFFGVEQVEVED